MTVVEQRLPRHSEDSVVNVLELFSRTKVTIFNRRGIFFFFVFSFSLVSP